MPVQIHEIACTAVRQSPAICSAIYEIKDSRVNLEDCESKVCEDDEPELCELRRNYAPAYDSPDKEVLQYKVYGNFKNHTDEQGKIDTYWLSMWRAWRRAWATGRCCTSRTSSRATSKSTSGPVARTLPRFWPTYALSSA